MSIMCIYVQLVCPINMRFPYEQYFLDALLAMCPKPLTRALLGVMRQRDDQTRLGLAHHPEQIPS